MNRTVRNAAVVAAAIAIDLTFWSGEVQALGGSVVPIWLPGRSGRVETRVATGDRREARLTDIRNGSSRIAWR